MKITTTCTLDDFPITFTYNEDGSVSMEAFDKTIRIFSPSYKSLATFLDWAVDFEERFSYSDPIQTFIDLDTHKEMVLLPFCWADGREIYHNESLLLYYNDTVLHLYDLETRKLYTTLDRNSIGFSYLKKALEEDSFRFLSLDDKLYKVSCLGVEEAEDPLAQLSSLKEKAAKEVEEKELAAAPAIPVREDSPSDAPASRRISLNEHASLSYTSDALYLVLPTGRALEIYVNNILSPEENAQIVKKHYDKYSYVVVHIPSLRKEYYIFPFGLHAIDEIKTYITRDIILYEVNNKAKVYDIATKTEHSLNIVDALNFDDIKELLENDYPYFITENDEDYSVTRRGVVATTSDDIQDALLKMLTSFNQALDEMLHDK